MTAQVQDPPTARSVFLQGPGVCGNDLEDRDWAGTVVLALPDGARMGVRSTSAGLLEAVAGLYADLVVDEEGPALYSLVVGEPGRRRKEPLHFLHVGGQVVAGTRDLGRLVRTLVRHAGDLLAPPPLSAVATVVELPDGRLLLAPPDLQSTPAAVDRVLVAAGVRIADAGAVALEADGVSLVRPGAGPDPDALDLDDLRGRGPSAVEPVVTAGRRPVAGWLVAVRPDDAGPLRGARAVAATARLLLRPYPVDATSALTAVVDLVEHVPVTGVSWTDADDLAEQVLAAARP